MTLPFALPDWLPWWVPIAVLVPALLWLLAFLFLPFSVLGTKSRLDVIEARLDEIQGEIRSLALRLPEAAARGSYDLRGYDELYAAPPRQPPRAEADTLPDRPPIPPPATDWYASAPPPEIRPPATPRGRPDPVADGRADRRASAGRRAEPRLDWPDR